MGLRFKQKEEVIFVEGTIDSTSIKKFKSHLEFLVLYCQSLKINLDGAEFEDQKGIGILKDVYKSSVPANKTFSIVGKKGNNYINPSN